LEETGMFDVRVGRYLFRQPRSLSPADIERSIRTEWYRELKRKRSDYTEELRAIRIKELTILYSNEPRESLFTPERNATSPKT